jgi:Ca2+-binding EF-hand superfamily protein
MLRERIGFVKKKRCRKFPLDRFFLHLFYIQNSDGEVSKAEVKLAHKQLSMKQIEEIMRLIDENRDGHISLAEFNSASAD